jgi:TonB family protein
MLKVVSLGAAALLLGLGASGVAAMPGNEHQQWFADALEKRLTYPFSHSRSEIGGIAFVAFEVAEGRRSNARILRGSRHLALDHAALKAIETLPEFPASFPCGSHIAVVQFGVAGSNGELIKLERKRAAAIGEAKRIAQVSEQTQVAGCPADARRALVLVGAHATG